MNDRKRLRLARRQFAGVAEVGRFIGALSGLVFLGIGLTVLGFLWLTPFNQFGSPPLFFRIAGSFIAIIFVGVGGVAAFGAIMGKRFFDRQLEAAAVEELDVDEVPESGQRRYTCGQCGAPLADEADVSPHGDVKCTYCNAWFNIYGS